jgi:hypothetical protein
VTTRRSVQPYAAAALLGVAVLMSMGSVAEASTTAILVTTRQAVLGDERAQREAVSHWLNCLTDAARRMHAQPAAAAAQPSPRSVLDLLRLPRAAATEAPQPEPPAPIDCRLIDLPPPTL